MQGWGEVVGGFAIALALAVGFHAHTEREAMNRFWYRAIDHRVEVERELREENAMLRAELGEVRDYANRINRAVHWLVLDRARRGGLCLNSRRPCSSTPRVRRCRGAAMLQFA